MESHLLQMRGLKPRLQKYFGTKMMKPLNLAFIFVK